MSLEGTVHLPVVGNANKKQLVIAGAGVLLVGIYLYRKRQAAAAAASTSSTNAGSGSAPSAGTDPATGYPYGSPEDTAALQASSLAAYGGYSGAVGGGGGGGALSTPPASGSGSGGFATNAQWAQAAEDYLANSTGGDPNAISAALGKYLTGGYLNDSQVSIVQSAIAFEGYPPVAGTFGYPPSYHSGTAPGGPPVQGPPADHAPEPVTFLHVIQPVQRNVINFAWYSSAGGADHYEVYMDGREIGTTNNTNTYAGNLKPGSRHTFTVIAVSKGGKKSAPVSMTATTAK